MNRFHSLLCLIETSYDHAHDWLARAPDVSPQNVWGMLDLARSHCLPVSILPRSNCVVSLEISRISVKGCVRPSVDGGYKYERERINTKLLM